ncbi:MAG: hypothetical protein N2235_18145 [Fischerella sp.]|nr:hypothetical protein [Fischerella sp.]
MAVLNTIWRCSPIGDAGWNLHSQSSPRPHISNTDIFDDIYEIGISWVKNCDRFFVDVSAIALSQIELTMHK